MASTGIRFLKFTLFIFNLILFLAGLLLILVGTVVMVKFDSYFEFFGSTMTKAALNVIAVGLLVLIIGFFGYCGVYKGNYCMIITFAGLLLMVLALEVVAVIVSYVLRHQINSIVTGPLKQATINYNKTNHEGVTLTWDKAQTEFHCCGATSYTDWQNNEILNLTESVPDSCCVKPETGCGLGLAIQNSTEIYSTGCVVKFINWSNSSISIIGGTAAGLAILQVIGVIVACCLAKSIKGEYEVV